MDNVQQRFYSVGADISRVEQELDTYKEKLKDLKEKVSANKQTLESKENDLERLKEQEKGIDAEISSILPILDSFREKQLIDQSTLVDHQEIEKHWLDLKENLEISVSTPKSPLNLINKSIKEEQLNEIERLMKIVNLAQKVDSKAGSLSHGQKQWLEIAMLVGQKPDLMLVDEPVAGLTDEETDLTADLLKSLSGENTVVVIDHDMEFIRRLDSNVSVLNQGTVLCEGTMETIQKDQKVIDVYLGRPED